jgi:hypothetical protein
MSRAKVDSELNRQLDAAARDEGVSASFSLDPGSKQAVIPPEEVEQRVQKLLKKVEREVGAAPRHCRVHKNIGSFSVTADPTFIRKLMEQDDVVTATANRQPEAMLIKPVSSERVAGPSPERPGSSRGHKKK